jgi:DNA-binding transcriptional LysR family regulator
VDWGPAFDIQHTQSYPDLEPPPQVVSIGWLGVQLMLSNGGSCYLPARMANPLIAAGRLYAVVNAPRYPLSAYLVYPKASDNPVIPQALEGMRALSPPAGSP